MLPIIIQSTVWTEEFFPCVEKIKEGCHCFFCGIWHCVPCFLPCYAVGCCQAYCDKDRKSAEKDIKLMVREKLQRDRAKIQIAQKREEIKLEKLAKSGVVKKRGCSKYVF